MSIVIRLQNLPLSAKSADIRNFFGGLRIPSGGVHIIGGERGDAFIAFNSDEDARLAMRKDGGKIKDSRVKLYLSSRMEMQYEVERITKNDHKDSSNIPEKSPFSDMYYRSSERKYESNRSPDMQWGRHPIMESYPEKSRSPNTFRRARSRSPKRRSRSHRSPSPNFKAAFQEGRLDTPEYQGFNPFANDVNMSTERAEINPYSWENSQAQDSSKFGLSKSEIQAQLERRITEAIEQNSILMSGGGVTYHENLQNLDTQGGNAPEPPIFPQPFTNQSVPGPFVPNELNYPPPYVNAGHYEEAMPSQVPGMFPNDMGGHMNAFYYLAVSGLDPLWDFHEVQVIFSGVLLAAGDIRWEVDNSGLRTGAVFVKLTNRSDFESIIRKATFMFNDRCLTVSECHRSLISHYFHENPKEMFDYERTENTDLCYALKGLPFACTYEDIIYFFKGLDVADVVIFADKNGKATGNGFVSFTNRRDFEAAFTQNRKNIMHRFIVMVPSTDKKMAKAKLSNKSVKPISVSNINKNCRSLCAIITGLPHFTSIKKLVTFFEQSGFKADAIHLTFNKRNCDGRAFIEFTNFRDFDLALKLNGSMFQEGIMICVKQILYDEMKKILLGQKAKHHYSTSMNIEPEFVSMPEKVPYLWEPPDSSEGQDDAIEESFASRKNFNRNKQMGQAPDNFNSNRMKPKGRAFHSPDNLNRNIMQPMGHAFPSPDNFNSNRMQPMGYTFPPPPDNFSNRMQQMGYNFPFDNFNSNMTQMVGQISFPPTNFSNIGLQPVEQDSFLPEDNFDNKMQQNFKQNANRHGGFRKQRVLSLIPLQNQATPEVKKQDSPKNDVKKESSQHMHDSCLSKNKNSPPNDVKKESSQHMHDSCLSKNKNSPPKDTSREPIKFNVNKPLAINAKKNETFESSEKAEEKIKLSKLSPVKETMKSCLHKEVETKEVSQEKKTFQERKNTPEVEKSVPKANKVFQRSQSEKTPLKRHERKTKPRSRSPIRHLSPPRHTPCVVQLSNVCFSVNTQDLMNFLYEFAYDASSIIRRYTDSGQPTGDVRVTFLNRKEADLAIKMLNQSYLKNRQIGMFIVS